MNALFLSLALAPATDPTDWKTAEAAHLKNIKQVTFDFVRAGEGYFSPDGKKIIFQAEEKEHRQPVLPDLRHGSEDRQSHSRQPRPRPHDLRLLPPGRQERSSSPAATTTRTRRSTKKPRYKQREEDRKNNVHRRYSWDFDPHMKIYEANLDGTDLKCLTPNAKVYTAEGSYSADGKKIVFSSGQRAATCSSSS